MRDARHILPDAPEGAVVPPASDRPGVWHEVGLTAYEHERIVALLGREPNALELELFGVMWSEHCSYKSSKALLRRLPTSGERVLQGPGENAGAIRVGQHTVVFKIESHNSPSAVAPYDGAATGVGGVLRDIFTMGARPVAVLDSLRFGPPDEPRQQQLLDEATAGIADYAAGMGLQSAASELRWDASYRHNPLVNAMAVGVTQGKLYKGVAGGPGNRLLVFGRPTGRDGVRSASFSSQALPGEAAPAASAAGSLAGTPVVPAGDPAMGKRVMEATLELLAQGVIVGMQDMGAAGFTSTTCEMAAKAGTGVVVDVSRVHKVDDSIQPFEVMLSETQERMLAVVEAGQEQAVAAVLEAHGVPYSFCGEVTGDGVVRVLDGHQELAAVPASYLAAEAPVYVWPLPEADAALAASAGAGDGAGDGVGDGVGDHADRPAAPTGATTNMGAALRQLLRSPDLADVSGLRRRYGADEAGTPRAGIIDLGGSGPETALALCVYGNGRQVALDAYRGTQACVAVAARRVAAAGARPVAITNGLNYGSPERPHVYQQLERSITGMADACRALGTPVTGGNVSLFNEKGGQVIYPTPMIGMVGVLSSAAAALPHGFHRSGNAVVLLGATGPGLAGSTFEHVLGGAGAEGSLPPIDLEHERRLHALALQLAASGLTTSATAVDEGGLAVALAQMCFAAAEGAAGCHVAVGDASPSQELFGESHGRMLLEVEPAALNAVLAAAEASGVPARRLGTVAEATLRIDGADGVPLVSENVAELQAAWREATPITWAN